MTPLAVADLVTVFQTHSALSPLYFLVIKNFCKRFLLLLDEMLRERSIESF